MKRGMAHRKMIHPMEIRLVDDFEIGGGMAMATGDHPDLKLNRDGRGFL